MLLKRALPLSLCLAAVLSACAGGDALGPEGPGRSPPRSDRINPDPLPRSVRFVWFVPSDVPFDSATVAGIGRAAYNTRSWYRAQLDGVTFSFDEDFPVEVIFGKHTRNWYETTLNPYGWDPIWNANYQVDMEVIQRLSVSNWSPLYKVAIYMSAEGGGGASNGRLVVPQHDVDGLREGVLNINRWWGGLAHELAHAFDLPDASSDDGTIASGALYRYPRAVITPELKARLLGSQRNEGFFAAAGPEFAPAAFYRIVNDETGLVAEGAQDGADGAPVTGARALAAVTQHWRLEPGPNGTWRIRHRPTSRLLVVSGGSAASGATLELRGEGQTERDTWYVLAIGPAHHELVPAHTIVPNVRAQGLTVPPGATAGSLLTQQDYVTAPRQSWRFEQVQ